jgi:hypothetical protein
MEWSTNHSMVGRQVRYSETGPDSADRVYEGQVVAVYTAHLVEVETGWERRTTRFLVLTQDGRHIQTAAMNDVV